MRLSLLLVPLLAACTSPGGDDVEGPFTGEVQRYAIDGITLPRNGTESRSLADDLDGDGVADNQLGGILGTLASFDDLTDHAADMIASGVIASSVEIQADDLANDPTVAVRYLGADGEMAIRCTGTFADGVFQSNRTRETEAPGQAFVHLPILVDSDPVVTELDGMELDLVPDGRGGFDGIVRGGFAATAARDAAFAGIAQMLANNPGDHLYLARILDTDHDGVVSAAEISGAPTLQAILQPDLRLFDADGTYAPRHDRAHADALSAGFGIHLTPCADGRCTTAAPNDPCHDRVRDGDETDVDCGGSCGACPTAASCATAADCQSGSCDAGACAAPSCSDGVLDGLESDVDCGGGCGACDLGQQCVVDADCASRHCYGQCELYPH